MKNILTFLSATLHVLAKTTYFTLSFGFRLMVLIVNNIIIQSNSILVRDNISVQ
jgi:hypothetical protein